jgi:magnesium chelatase family protein
VGPPGIGKTMLARRIPGLLPPLSAEESLEVSKIYSSVGLGGGALIRERPFRAPHHSASTTALVGGGAVPHAGEVSLAHNGVLFLDEMPEFRRDTLEALRQPLESGSVTIARALESISLPARFLLAASANPCPCGWFGSRDRACVCSPGLVGRYQARLSGPLLDRIDLQVRVNNLAISEQRSLTPAECSDAIRSRVVLARQRQHRRLASLGAPTNGAMTASALRATCKLSDAAETLLARLWRARGWSGRAVDRVIRTARTVVDLADGADVIDDGAILEAASYRSVQADAAGRRVGCRVGIDGQC